MNDQVLKFNKIKKQFPDEWVLLQLTDAAKMQDKSGIVLYHSKDYLELCYKGSEIAKDILTTIIFTGKPKPTRKWLKATRLKDPLPTTSSS